MDSLSLDLETYSDVNLAKCGVYRYAESPKFEILLLAYSEDHGPVQVIDLAQGEAIPEHIIAKIKDTTITKWAFNSQFERVCLSNYVGEWLSPKSWKCSMIWAATLGLPMSLEGVGAVLKLKQQKMREGKALIRYFCVPCKPTKANGGRTRNLPKHDAEKWATFKAYNKRDVETELAIKDRLSKYPVSDNEWLNFHIDQKINDRGIEADIELVNHAIECDRLYNQIVTTRAYELTGLENPNSVVQLKGWLSEQGIEAQSLSKQAVKELIENADGEVLEVLKLRLAMSKTSIKKYQAIERSVCKDGRVHGLLQFYGANRTGRYAGRLVQVQNLPQNHIKDLSLARNLVKEERYRDIELLYESTPNVLSELIRTAFVPKRGCKFMVADFSAVEARVIAWMAGEKWRMEVFATHGKIYEASASAMFHVPIESIHKGEPLRQKGKIAELALGYGGSVGALTSMGALNMGVEESELKPLVDAWRSANPNIVKFWWDVDHCASRTVREHIPTFTHGIQFTYESGILFITLHSGRRLAYVKPRIGKNRFDRDAVTYEGIGATKKWERIETYGPKLVENIVQATARDLLTDAMQRVTAKGYEIVMTVHDEIVVEASLDASLEDLCQTMGETPSWANGLLLRTDGYQCKFYKKD